MCIFTGKVSNVTTLIGAWEAGHNEKGLPLQGIVYKNSFTTAGGDSRSNPRSQLRSTSNLRSVTPTPNFDWVDLGYTTIELPNGLAMVWPIPIHKGANIFSDVMMLRDCKNLAEDMTAFRESAKSKEVSENGTRGGGHSLVVEHGDYTVVLADRPTAAAGAITGVASDRQPQLNTKMFETLEEWYPGWGLLIACINPKKALDADPFGIIFPTRHAQLIYLPTLDDHLGEGPDLRQTVDLNHRIAVGSVFSESGTPITYRDRFSAATLELLPRAVVGGNLNSSMINGDLYCTSDDVRNGRFRYIRKSPPGVSL